MRPGDAERDRLLALLDAAARDGRAVTVWWRDDDAVDATPQLERLLGLASSHSVPLGLAVIPKRATPGLAARLADVPAVAVLQHGWSHRSHSPNAKKKAELGDDRPIETVLCELAAGRTTLDGLFGDRFLPVLVPPWNRIGATVRARRGEAGLTGLSTFGPRRGAEPHVVNTHVDVIDWGAQATQSRAAVFGLLHRLFEQCLLGHGEPIGLLTHHLVHDEAAWQLIDDILLLLAEHPAVEWPAAAPMFAASATRP
jgi:hypothetical protein